MHALAPPKEDAHEQRMWEADLDAVDQAVACALEDSEIGLQARVCNDLFDYGEGSGRHGGCCHG